MPSLPAINARIVACERCPRLAKYCRTFREREGYWGRPVAGFGDPKARLLLLGLAPGAHGANRTGRPFTGDGAGVFLYRALHELGLSDRATSVSRDDGLTLRGAYIANVVKCVPPENKPTPHEIATCAPFLTEEIAALRDVRAVLALGRTAHDAWLRHVATSGTKLRKRDYPFAHGRVHRFDAPTPPLVDSFHPSRYNVNVGKLTYPMFRDAMATALEAAAPPARAEGARS